MELVGEAFTDLNAAENFSQTLEAPLMEEVSALNVTDAMRADIRTNGLPCLGAVGKRATTDPLAPTF